MITRYLLSTCLLTLIACGGGDDNSPSQNADTTLNCGQFGSWSSSDYRLPYSIGATFFLNQSNCSGFGHSGFWTYGYDFTMDIGTQVVSMRDGIVVHTQDGTVDGNPNGTNLILIEHSDGTIALYSHLTINGVLVVQGQQIMTGELIGLSGNSGNTGGLPHLHVSLHPCIGLPGLTGISNGNCPTQPFNFNNAEPGSDNLIAKRNYLAI